MCLPDGFVVGGRVFSPQKLAIVSQVHDRMTEQMYSKPLTSFAVDTQPTPVYTVPVMEQGRQALIQINEVRGFSRVSILHISKQQPSSSAFGLLSKFVPQHHPHCSRAPDSNGGALRYPRGTFTAAHYFLCVVWRFSLLLDYRVVPWHRCIHNSHSNRKWVSLLMSGTWITTQKCFATTLGATQPMWSSLTSHRATASTPATGFLGCVDGCCGIVDASFVDAMLVHLNTHLNTHLIYTPNIHI